MDEQCCPLTKVRFVARIRAVLETVGYPSAQFAGHSFQIGAAKAVVQVGLEDLSNKALGQ